MRDDVNWHEVEACVGSKFVYVVIAPATAVFHSCLLLNMPYWCIAYDCKKLFS